MMWEDGIGWWWAFGWFFMVLFGASFIALIV
jgi:hypothetical protein